MRKSIGILLVIGLLIMISQVITDSPPLDMNKAALVDEKIHRTGGTFKIEDNFDAYFLMRDYDRSPLPLLVRVKFDYAENKAKNISDNISNFSIEVHGMNSQIKKRVNDDDQYYYSFINIIENIGENNEVIETKNHEAEVAYLKNKFKNEIKIISNNNHITYTVNEEINQYPLSLDFIRNPQKDELNLTVRDKGEAIHND